MRFVKLTLTLNSTAFRRPEEMRFRSRAYRLSASSRCDYSSGWDSTAACVTVPVT